MLTELIRERPLKDEWDKTIHRCNECSNRINGYKLVICKICHKVFDEDKDEMNPKGSTEESAWCKCITCRDAFCTDCLGFLLWEYHCENDCPEKDCHCEYVQCVVCRFRQEGSIYGDPLVD